MNLEGLYNKSRKYRGELNACKVHHDSAGQRYHRRRNCPKSRISPKTVVFPIAIWVPSHLDMTNKNKRPSAAGAHLDAPLDLRSPVCSKKAGPNTAECMLLGTPAKKGYSTFRLKSQDTLNAPKCAYISSVGSELSRADDLTSIQRLGRPDPPT
eukprot:4842217-Pleurochrysis_carterae.AAC.3